MHHQRSSNDQIANLVSGHCSCAIAPRGEAPAHVRSCAKEDERPRQRRAEKEGDDREEPAGVGSHLPGRHVLGRPRRRGRDAGRRVVREEQRHGGVFIWRQDKAQLPSLGLIIPSYTAIHCTLLWKMRWPVSTI